MERSTAASASPCNSERQRLLLRIPSLQRLLETSHGQALCRAWRREDAVEVMRRELDRLRTQLLTGPAATSAGFEHDFFANVERELQRRRASPLRRVINATGVVLHTNLGRAPLADEAIAAVRDAASGYCNLEFDLERGERGSRHDLIEERLCRLSGAEAALAVNNCAAAVLLVLTALARGGDVLASRGELIEIGGSFRMPDVIEQSGARLVEVGTTNKTRLADYERAAGAATRVILKSHPSNYRIVGFTSAAEPASLARFARERGLVFVHDLGSGTLVDLRPYGLPYEPTVRDCLRDGAHLVTFSGDKLLGGPQAGLIVGRRAEIALIKKHPLLRALRIDKLSLAALEATLRLYEDAVPPQRRVPALRMLSEAKPSLLRRSRRLARQLRAVAGVECEVLDGASLAGGGSLPGAQLPTSLIRLRVGGMSADELARRLRRQQPALIGRIVDDCVALDLRTVTAREAGRIAALVARAIA